MGEDEKIMFDCPEPSVVRAFFESDPVESDAGEHAYTYRAADERGFELYFWYNAVLESIGANISVGGAELVAISAEQAIGFTVKKDESGEYLFCRFEHDESETTGTIHIRPEIKLSWWTLAV